MNSSGFSYHLLSTKILQKLLSQEKEIVIFETLKFDEQNFRSYIFLSPKGKLVLNENGSIKDFFVKLETLLNKGYYLAGFFSYELGYFLDYKGQKPQNLDFPLAFFYVFQKPIIFDHKTGKFLTEDKEKLSAVFTKYPLSKNNNKFSITNSKLNISQQEYILAVNKLKHYISYGETYQVNYTIKTKFNFKGSISGLYTKLRQTQKVSYAAVIKTEEFIILSFSPELFFRKQNDLITVKPMKGTISRGKNIYEDTIQQNKLYHSIKDKAENLMIVDLLRNDLGKISPYGKVNTLKLFEIEKYETLFQMTSTIQTNVNPKISLYKIFKSIFPSGSVTGAPKIRTMQIIKEIEKEPRKVYTGAIGFFTPKKDAVFNVAIRTVLINRDGSAEMGIGSGIVVDSQTHKEFAECNLKSMFLFKNIPKFRLIETILYTSNFDKEIKNFHKLNLNITKNNFQHGYFLLDYHIERIKNSALYFGFKFDEQKVISKLIKLKSLLEPNKFYKIRLLLSYEGKIKLEFYKIQQEIFCSSEIVLLGVSSKTVDKEDVFLYHKTTNRRIYNNEYKKCILSGCFDIIFKNQNNEITECSKSNIFIYSKGKYYTAPINSGLLNGVVRQYLINMNKEKIIQKPLFITDILSAEKIFITNAIIGIREAKLKQSFCT